MNSLPVIFDLFASNFIKGVVATFEPILSKFTDTLNGGLLEGLSGSRMVDVCKGDPCVVVNVGFLEPR